MSIIQLSAIFSVVHTVIWYWSAIFNVAYSVTVYTASVVCLPSPSSLACPVNHNVINEIGYIFEGVEHMNLINSWSHVTTSTCYYFTCSTPWALVSIVGCLCATYYNPNPNHKSEFVLITSIVEAIVFYCRTHCVLWCLTHSIPSLTLWRMHVPLPGALGKTSNGRGILTNQTSCKLKV